jgi:Trk K+ transport system NAD-binding subunit
MSKIDLDEIYNPSHKLKSDIYKTIHHQSLTDKKNKLFQNSILNLAKEKKKKVSGEELFQRLNDLRLKEQKIQKIITYCFLSALVGILGFFSF